MVTVSYLHRTSCRSTPVSQNYGRPYCTFCARQGLGGQSVHSGYTATSGYKLHGSHVIYGLYSTKPEGGGGGWGLYKAI